MIYTTIISHVDLAGLLQQSAAPHIVVFDARFKLDDADYGQRAYDAGHIPGAWYLHLDRDLSGPITNSTGRHPLPTVQALEQTMRRHGVSSNTQVIVYDDAGGMFASRCWWMLHWLGHSAVAVLDGGWPAWQKSGGSIAQDNPALPASGDFTAVVNSSMVLSAAEVQQGLEQSTLVLCDARAPERYRGDVEPIDKVAGHVPGAINVPFASNLNSDGTFKSVAQLTAIHNRIGNVVHMCGSGVTACHNLLATAIAGLPMPKLYAGSWSEWIRDPQRAVTKG